MSLIPILETITLPKSIPTPILIGEPKFSSFIILLTTESITFIKSIPHKPALLEIIKLYKGNVIDIMGDGIMVFWGGAKDRSKNFMFKSTASQVMLL